MTDPHELNRPVMCLLYAVRGVTQQIKARERLPITDSVGQHRSHYQLRVVGALRLSTVVVSFSFFESDTTASGASYTTKSSWKEPLRLTTISSVIWELANLVM